MQEVTKLLETILVAQVLVLEKEIKAEKKSKGVSSSGDYYSDAVNLLTQKQPQIVALLRQQLQY